MRTRLPVRRQCRSSWENARTDYAGLDVSPCIAHPRVIDDDSELHVESKTDSEVADIVTCLDELDVGTAYGSMTPGSDGVRRLPVHEIIAAPIPEDAF